MTLKPWPLADRVRPGEARTPPEAGLDTLEQRYARSEAYRRVIKAAQALVRAGESGSDGAFQGRYARLAVAVDFLPSEGE